MTKFVRKVFRKLKKVFQKPQPPIDWDEKKRKDDFEFLISQGVETEYGYVALGGLPIIQKHPNSKIIIGKGVTLLSDSSYNAAGINHPVILATYAENAIIELKDGCGMSGTSIVSVNKVQVGYNTMLGVNTNLYDTDFHPVDSIKRNSQKSILEAESAPIVIGDNVWVGANSTVLKGVAIGNNSVVGAYSLVNKNIGENELHVGVPAKFKKIVS